MVNNGFYKVYGADGRQDRLIMLSATNHLLIFGFRKEGDSGYNWRKNYDHRPTEDELRSDISALINRCVDEEILSGFTYDGHLVWLSQENQFNYKAAYDLAIQTGGDTLPVTFKFGTDTEPYYYVFDTIETLTDFYHQTFSYIQQTLAKGWEEKDNILNNYKNEENLELV